MFLGRLLTLSRPFIGVTLNLPSGFIAALPATPIQVDGGRAVHPDERLCPKLAKTIRL